MVTDDYNPLPPPAADDTYDNLKTKHVRVTDGRKKRQAKGLVQLNVKVRGRIRDHFEEAYEQAQRRAGELTKGEFFELLLTAYRAKESSTGLRDAAEAIQREAAPPPTDRAAGRTKALTFFATPALAKVLDTRSRALGWTLSETVEHACELAKASQNKR